jgi:hypothetical protein
MLDDLARTVAVAALTMQGAPSRGIEPSERDRQIAFWTFSPLNRCLNGFDVFAAICLDHQFAASR